MNHCVPDWNFEGDLPVTNQKKSIGPDHELVELLWRNGQVVLNSQTHRKQDQARQVGRHDQPSVRGIGSYGNSSHLIQDDDTVSWIHNPFEDSFEKEFCSSLFTDLPSADPAQNDKAPVKQFDNEKFVKFNNPNPTHVPVPLQQQQQQQQTNPMPPPRFQLLGSAQRGGTLEGIGNFVSFTKVSTTTTGELGASKGRDVVKPGKAVEGSTMTVGSSHCGSNQVQNDPDWSRVSSSGFGTTGLSARPFKDDLHHKAVSQSERGQTETIEPTLTSSSGGSGSSFGRTCRQSSGFTSHKRKATDVEESESQSEAAELESAAGNKSSRRSGSARRSRAAEVHNLSERRRRDRINEKMKALQELIPHCNKTDKASMLDEAIEYLKSLQLQLQVMWMGGGMGPMMFPGVQHYISRMSMGMASPSLASIPNPMLSRVPLLDQSMSVAQTPNQAVMCQTPVMNPVNFPNQMQNPAFSEQYARYMNFHQMQATPQAMNVNMFRFGPQAMQQSHPMAPPGNSLGPFSGGAATTDPLSGKTS